MNNNTLFQSPPTLRSYYVVVVLQGANEELARVRRNVHLLQEEVVIRGGSS